MRRLFLTWLALCGLVYGAAYADDMSLLGVGTTKTVASGGATTTFDPANLGASITLSSGNLKAAGSASSTGQARSVTSHSTGKFCSEYTVTTYSSNNVQTGVAVGGATLNSTFLGFDSTNSAGDFNTATAAYLNGSSIGSVTTYTQTDIRSVAVDLGAQLIWFRTVTGGVTLGNWNNSGTAHPATGTGGLSLSGIAAGPYFAAIVIQDVNVMTANFNTATTVGCDAATVAAGFGNW